MSSCKLTSVNNDNYKNTNINDEIENLITYEKKIEEKNITQNIKTITIHHENWELGYPIIKLNSKEKISY